MTSNIINELEEKVNRAIEIIADLRKSNENLLKETETLTRQLDELRNQYEQYKKTAESRLAEADNRKPEFDVDEIRNRLQKLTGKLAALEDSWT